MITITAYKKEDFRKWLQKNHKKESKVAIIIHKRHTGKPAPSHRELMEEAICFGWIDTTIKRIDEDTFLRYFSKRTLNSRWSDNTIGYAKRLIEEGKMSEEGLYFYKLGLAKPTHDFGIPKNPSMPRDLGLALSKDPELKKKFKTFPPSFKKTMYRWILRAKQPVTRAKRIERILANVSKGDKNIF
ncbi:MAG: YdeI/OmpD-associated family protein [Candidatus Yanofskybacteria bacterium]|nr:YdeI/OmpD-associated family protein [Candidatus Yanofskybacteria bacterium]